MAKKTKKRLKWLDKKSSRIVVCLLLTIVVGYLAGVLYYQGKFLSGTKINGLDVSSMTLDETNEALQNNIGESSIELVFNDDQSETIALQQLGVSFNENNSTSAVMDQQNHWLWFMSYFDSDEQWLDDVVSIDDALLNQGLASLTHAQPENQVAPVDAYIQYENGSFSIVKESYGSTLQMENLIEGIKVGLGSGQDTVNVEEVNGYVLPNVYEDDEDLNNKLEAANTYCLARVTYNAKGETVTLDGSTMIDWLTKQEDGTYIIDDAIFTGHLETFVANLAKKMNTSGETRTFTGADGLSHTVSGGNYGYRISQSAEVSALLNIIKENKVEENRSPEATGATTSVNGGIGNTFVEVNISKQHLWVHKDGVVVLESDFVSGTETVSDRRTPSGTYYIYNKERNRVLRGTRQPDGSYEYESPVSYWMPFNRGIGFHDASWRSSFGGSIYQTSGSHGCINLPSGVASQMYSLVTVNMPVVVYR